MAIFWSQEAVPSPVDGEPIFDKYGGKLLELTREEVDGVDVLAKVDVALDDVEEVVGALDAGANNGWIRATRSALVPVASKPRRKQ